MKKFRFKLETLLKVTRMNKEKAQVALATATKEVEEARATLQVYLQEMAQGQRAASSERLRFRINTALVSLYSVQKLKSP